jgi:hypothetical protein
VFVSRKAPHQEPRAVHLLLQQLDQRRVLVQLARELEHLLDHVVGLQVLRPDGHLRARMAKGVVSTVMTKVLPVQLMHKDYANTAHK